MIQFLIETKDYGLRVALCNALINFTKWAVGAKSIKITYRRK
jgi:hypothetical protein